ncbi:LPS-assembly protein LptD [Longimicrobium sp.]|uniref:LPS-assembly protein LptD n=1 Tax=Longimicrobium sp. TaxID=2029185 RepID=UPI002BD5DC79|nr:putative LPS assembly protein LptD [Longimicrobium sp.]HSU13357.1 putative LPS assembly protein LptD [Longimicrobium sp.]
MKHRAVIPLLAALWAACALAPAAAQVIPGMNRGQQRAPQPAQRPNTRAPGDTSRPAATGRPAQSDSVIDALLKLQGYVPIFYNADSADYRSLDRALRLRGNSRVEREGDVITARDSIVYRDLQDLVAAYGNPQGTPTEGEPIAGDVFFYDLNARRANVFGARTKITENATWYVAGDVTSERNERIYANNSTFTSDDRPNPAYYFKADRIMIIRNRILVGRPAYLYFRNVPVMALPFIVQDLEHGRRSGFLIPQFEINDIIRTRGGTGNSRGTGREISNIGYYWAISPFLGLQVAGRWRSQSYMAARGNLEFNFRRRFLSGQIEGERFWETDGPGRLNLNGGANWSLNERTKLALALGFASSTAFERNRVVDPFRQTADLSSNFSLTREFDFGSLSLSAERRQSVGNDDRTFSPRFGLNLNPITLVPNVVFTTSFSGSSTQQSFGNALLRRQPSSSTGDFSGSGRIAIGNFGVDGSAAYSHSGRGSLAAIQRSQVDSTLFSGDTTRLAAIAGNGADHLRFSVNTGYQLTLFASTRLTPTIGFSRELLRRDTTGAVPDSLRGAYGEYVAGPPRLNLGVALGTDLYGFFPGFGNYETIRHHIQPVVSYTYSPTVTLRDTGDIRVQRQVFGPFSARAVNQIQIGLNQTFEAKLRTPKPVRGDSARDTAAAAGNRAAPSQSQKITLLALNTSAIGYSFVGSNRFNERFLTPELSTTVRTDLLGGFQFQMSHSLFDQRIVVSDSGRSELKRGRFQPFLTSFSTQFTLGQNSALFRWLGFARGSEEQRVSERGQTPDARGEQTQTPLGNANATANNQQAGGGPWSLGLTYSLTRQRRSPADSVPGTFNRGNSQLGGRLTFQPTKNWAVSWQTQYSTTTGQFAAHTINLKRDLYRWQANFDYNLAPNGNTSFAFSVHLIDLPDLKADYHESNLGVDRPATSTLPAP